MMKINKLSIDGIGPIRKLDLEFDAHFNIICGQNGVGKTTILDCLAQSFSFDTITVKKTVGHEIGKWSLDYSVDGQQLAKTFTDSLFHPHENQSGRQGHHDVSRSVIVFKTHRDIPYHPLASLTKDPEKKDYQFANDTVRGVSSANIKNWFVMRHLWSAHENQLDHNQIRNLNVAKESFYMINPSISFSRVDPASHEILLNSPKGDIYFEYLSSGYKSCLAVLIGLIQEIEFRHKFPTVCINDFDGLVIIDELDLHLHPEWQAKIYQALKQILPKAQIFTTTHSPHIIQVAEPCEIIPLTFDENNEVVLNKIPNKKYGFQGWTVEEILTDVMGMEETRTDFYLSKIKEFNQSIENEDFEKSRECFHVIDSMLHPQNVLRKVLKIQIAGEGQND